MNSERWGEIFALLTAFTWAVAMVLFKRCGETITPVALNLFKNTLGLLLLGVTVAVIALMDPAQGPSVLADRPVGEIIVLLISGFLGIAVADTVFFKSLNIVGVGIQSIVDCTYSPFVILLSWIFLSERLTVPDYAGAALIVTAVFMASRHTPPPGKTRSELLAGIGWGCLAISLMVVGIVMARPILDTNKGNFPLLWATLIRLFAGTVPLALFALNRRHRQVVINAFIPSRDWKIMLPGSFIAAYVCMILWIAGFKYARTGVAAVLNQTSTIVALVLATLILKETFTARKTIAVILAMVGVVLVAL